MQGMTEQPTLFDAAPTRLPEGFRYQPDLLTPDEEAEIVPNVKELPFRNLEFHGYVGTRRVVSFGWRYDFDDRELTKAADIPEFLVPVRDRAPPRSQASPRPSCSTHS